MPDKIPLAFQLGDKLIDGATVNRLPFVKYTELIREINSVPGTKSYEVKLQRLRLAKQVTYHMNGATVPLTFDEVANIPIKSVWAIQKQLDGDDGELKMGKVIRPGDGIDSSIAYELGSPIPLGQGKEPITELEFLAKTLGDIEDVLSATTGMEQTAQLIRTVAKPVNSSLQALPSWAVEQITLVDGILIMQQVLPHFLGSAAE